MHVGMIVSQDADINPELGDDAGKSGGIHNKPKGRKQLHFESVYAGLEGVLNAGTCIPSISIFQTASQVLK